MGRGTEASQSVVIVRNCHVSRRCRAAGRRLSPGIKRGGPCRGCPSPHIVGNPWRTMISIAITGAERLASLSPRIRRMRVALYCTWSLSSALLTGCIPVLMNWLGVQCRTGRCEVLPPNSETTPPHCLLRSYYLSTCDLTTVHQST